MVITKKSGLKKEAEIEYRGPERAFKYDRDTVIVYTGLHREDMRPFIRIGAGDSTPEGLLKHIENVVLPDTDPVNVGLELYWLHSTLQRSGDVIRYIGSKDQISRLYNFSGLKELAEKQDVPVELAPYKPMDKGFQSGAKDKCLINFFETGDLNVSVGGTKVLALSNYKRGFMHLDKEYDLIERALRKRKRKCEEGYGFVFLEGSKTPGISLYMNFAKEGLLMNPPRDFHYRLFENSISPNNYSMCLAPAMHSPGFVEALRRKNAVKEPLGIFSMEDDRLSDLKRLYPQTKLKTFADSSTLPFAKEAAFFLSRGGAYYLLALQVTGKAEEQIYIMMPTGMGKPGKNFEYVRGPFDVEMALADSKDDLKTTDKDSKFTLHVCGAMKNDLYDRSRLSPGKYPLVGNREYKFVYAEATVGLYEAFSANLADSEYAERARDLMIYSLGVDFDPERAEGLLRPFLKHKAPKDIVLRACIYEMLRFVSDLPLVKDHFDERAKKLLIRLIRRFNIAAIKIGEWKALSSQDIEFHIHLLKGRSVYLLAVRKQDEPIRLFMPPRIDEIDARKKEYRTWLKSQTRVIDKADDAPGFSDCLAFLETSLEEREHLQEERKRFLALLSELNINLDGDDDEDRIAVPNFVPKFLGGAYESTARGMRSMVRSIRGLFSGWNT